MFLKAPWYLVPYANNLLKHLKVVAKPSLIITILELILHKQIEVAQFISFI